MYLPIFVVLCIMRSSFGQDSSTDCANVKYDPVCTNNGMEFANECYFNQAKSKNSDLEIDKHEPCWAELKSELSANKSMDVSEIVSEVVDGDEVREIAEEIGSNEQMEELVTKVYTDTLMLLVNHNALNVTAEAIFKLTYMVTHNVSLYNEVSSTVTNVMHAADRNHLQEPIDNALYTVLELAQNDPETSEAYDTLSSILYQLHKNNTAA